MEIQNRNNVLQQLLGTGQFGASAVSGLEKGFVDMLKSCGSKEAPRPQPNFSDIKRNTADLSKKQSVAENRVGAKDVKAKDAKRSDAVQKKTSEKKEVNANKAPAEERSKKEDVALENGVANETLLEESAVQAAPVASVQTENGEVSETLQNAVVEEIFGDVETVLGLEGTGLETPFLTEADMNVSAPLSAADGLDGAVSDVTAVAEENVAKVETVALPEETVVAVAAEVQNLEGKFSLPADEVFAIDSEMKDVLPEFAGALKNVFEGQASSVEESLKPEAVNAKQAENDAFAAMSEEDMLLMRQAKYLDDKIGSDKKMKIDVSLQEAKIAAPVSKDVLQNSFEVDAVLRQMDSANIEMPEEFDAPQLETAEAFSDAAPSDKMAVVAAKEPVAAVWQPSENAAKIVSDASQVSVSGKEYAAEAVNGAKTEAFARINETSSRDVFKGMGKEAVEQIKINITKSAVKGVDTIDIQLKPEDLGKIQIKMHIAKDGKLQAEIISGRQETLDMLQKEVSGLVKAFEDAGYEADSRSFSFNFQDEKQSGEQQKDDAGLLKFIGDALEQEADNAAGNDNLIYDPALGLNIRV